MADSEGQNPGARRDDLVAELLELRERTAASLGTGARAPESGDEGDRYRHLLESLRAVMIEVDERGHLAYLSPTVVDILGYHPDELRGRQLIDWVHRDDLASIAGVYRRAAETGEALKFSYRARHKNGHWVWLESTSVSYRSLGGGARTVAFTRDVSDVKRAGAALQESEDRLAAIVANASDLICELDAQGRFLYVSPNCERILGIPAEEIIGRSLADADEPGGVHPEDAATLLEGYRRNVVGSGRGERELRLRHADGSWRWFEGRGSSYTTQDGELRAVVIARDIGERRRAQDELRQSEERYRVIAATSRDLISETDSDGRLVYVGPTCREVLGYEPEEVVGTTPFHMLHTDDLDRCVAVFLEGLKSNGTTKTDLFRVRHKDDSWRWCEGAGVAYARADGSQRFLSVIRDVTDRRRAEEERRRLEEHMQQAQKLESLGVMAGGIAHDFNNLLTPILGDAALALQDVSEDSPAYGRLVKIKRAAQRAASLTRQMLAYTGKQSLHREVIDLSHLAREMTQLLESAISQKAVLVYDLRADLPAVEGDTAQLSQVVMNLITNASEAVADSKEEGRIVVRSGTAEVDADYARRTALRDTLAPGPYVYLEVEDNGCGMDEETRLRIFDPFFTTKFTGRGLGLAAVLGIVRGHGGSIELETAPGRGTRFRVLLPRSSRDVRLAAAAPVGASGWRGSGTVLVVDDDEGVRELTGETLRRCGLDVLSAADGGDALRLFRDHADEIRLVLLDRTMPATSGEEVFQAIREIRPDARIVLASGYSQQNTALHFAGQDVSGFLQKPFLPETLIEKVREVLAE